MKRPKDTPTIAAAKRVLAKAINWRTNPSPLPSAVQAFSDEAKKSAPRLARAVLRIERISRSWQELAEQLGAENKKMRASIQAGPVDIGEVLGEEE